MPPLTTNRAATITDAGSGLKPGLPLHTRSPFNSGPQHSIVLDTDPVVGAEFIPAFTAPFHLGQGGRSQVFPATMVDLINRCIAQADVQNVSGFEGLGCLEAHAVSAVIERHRSIFTMEPGAEGSDNDRRMRDDAFIFALICRDPRPVDFVIRPEFVFLLNRQHVHPPFPPAGSFQTGLSLRLFIYPFILRRLQLVNTVNPVSAGLKNSIFVGSDEDGKMSSLAEFDSLCIHLRF
jgi:hypothetical protein